MRFLLDANLSPKTSDHLRSMGHDVKNITEDKLGYLKDEEIVAIATKEKRVILTFDQDFGEIYQRFGNKYIGIIVLRIKDQTVKNVNTAITSLLTTHEQQVLRSGGALIIIKEKSIGIIK